MKQNKNIKNWSWRATKANGFHWIFNQYVSKVIKAFDDVIDDIISNKKLNQKVTALFIRGKSWIISTASTTQSYFPVIKDVTLNCTNLILQKFQRSQSFHKSHLIKYQTLNLKNIWIFKKLYCKTIMIFSLVPPTTLASEILFVSDAVFWKRYKN